MDKATFNKKKRQFTQKIDLKLRNWIVKSLIWSLVLYGSEAWTLKAKGKKLLEYFQLWTWRRMKICWTENQKNEVFHKVKEGRSLLKKNNVRANELD